MTTFFSTHLPYCITELATGALIALNRFYKPVGFHPQCGQVRYEDYPIAFKTKHGIEWLARAIGAEVTEVDGSKFIYLYKAETRPDCPAHGFVRQNFMAYLSKLEALARLSVMKPTLAEENLITIDWLMRKTAEAEARFAATGALAPSSAPLSFNDLA